MMMVWTCYLINSSSVRSNRWPTSTWSKTSKLSTIRSVFRKRSKTKASKSLLTISVQSITWSRRSSKGQFGSHPPWHPRLSKVSEMWCSQMRLATSPISDFHKARLQLDVPIQTITQLWSSQTQIPSTGVCNSPQRVNQSSRVRGHASTEVALRPLSSSQDRPDADDVIISHSIS